jgi:hypothetical protein
MSQAELGAHLPVTSQQIQKYEQAINKVAAADLVAFSTALECSINEFFEVG